MLAPTRARYPSQAARITPVFSHRRHYIAMPGTGTETALSDPTVGSSLADKSHSDAGRMDDHNEIAHTLPLCYQFSPIKFVTFMKYQINRLFAPSMIKSRHN